MTDKCVACGAQKLTQVLDLGCTPVANDLLEPSNLGLVEKHFPLKVNFCEECNLVQLSQYHSSNDIFSSDYVYFSSYSKYWLDHAERYCSSITKKLNLNCDSFVIEVASNDGYLLRNFVEKKIPCLGIEPTVSTATVAKKCGVPTESFFLTHDTSKYVVDKYGKADLVVANNVLAHVPDINNFVSGLRNILSNDGVLTVECPSILELIKHNEFDTVYHEHFFYYSLISVVNLFQRNGLKVIDVEKLETHGGSYRIYAAHLKSSRLIEDAVHVIIQEEKDHGIDSIKGYVGLQQKSLSIKISSISKLVEIKQKGFSIAAFGAAAKGNTFLNYTKIDSDFIDYVVDETPAKQGKILPGSRIPVVPLEHLLIDRPDYLVILPWNHYLEIKNKIKKLLPETRIIRFVPDFFSE